MSFPGPGQSPNNNGGGNNPFTNPFGRNNNAGNGKDSNGNGSNDGMQILNGNNVEYAQIVDNTQQVKLKLKSDYSATNPDTGRMKNYGKNVQFYYTYAQSAAVVKAVQKADPASCPKARPRPPSSPTWPAKRLPCRKSKKSRTS